jgi:hypothetical protein
MEDVLARNPRVIVDMGDMSQTEGVTEQHKRAVVALWNRHRSVAAVREGRVFAVASDIFTVPVRAWWKRRARSRGCCIRRPAVSFRLESVGMNYGARAVLSDVSGSLNQRG